MPPCTACRGDGHNDIDDSVCERCNGTCVEPEPNHDYLSDPADAPFAAWLDEEGIR
jgi:RecJ-like exonuclease